MVIAFPGIAFPVVAALVLLFPEICHDFVLLINCALVMVVTSASATVTVTVAPFDT
jgi:hypothetical protein